ncbi:MAG TPA: hypothetical protein VMT03_04970 [Polyangia bacterium]|nr:hypothetical protein [Polyangia bacterium]
MTAACALALAACSSGSGGGTGGSSGSGTGGTSPGTGGSSSTGGATGTGGSSSSGGTGGPATGTGGSQVSGTGGSQVSGSGGTSSTGGSFSTGGQGGSSAGGHAGSTSTGTGGGGGSSTTGSGGSSGFCPSGAIFCADFEEASGVPDNNPVGTATFSDPSEYGWTFGGSTMAAMILDSGDMPYDGKQSLKVNSSSSFSIRTLAVKVPQTFWVRLYIKSATPIGMVDHNSFFAAGVDSDYSKAHFVEVSEQFNCILLNQSDSLFPTGNTCGVNTALSANQWHCMAAQFDGATGNVQVFAGTTKIIDAAGWAPAKQAFTTFSFGYFDYNEGATVWYDDVVVSASPLSCP